MSLIQEFNQTKQAIQELQARLEQIQSDERFQRDREFEQQLRDLLSTYGKSLKDIVAIIDPTPSRVSRSTDTRSRPRQQRRMKTYKNPHTNEVIKTKGGNHNQLKEWKAKWGADQVESWVSYED